MLRKICKNEVLSQFPLNPKKKKKKMIEVLNIFDSNLCKNVLLTIPCSVLRTYTRY